MKEILLKLPIKFLLVFTFGFFVVQGNAQDSTKSLAIKPNHSFRMPFTLFYQSEVSYQLYENFMLIRKANDGDPQAAHEIGVRYLVGHGFDADTVQSYYWIEKAAEKRLPVALYNLGIFQNNGWGTEWNPYKAFDSFYASAEEGFPLGNYVLGLFFTENLVVPRNLSVASYFIKNAADQNVEQAKELLKELKKRNAVEVDSFYVNEFFKNRDNSNSPTTKSSSALSYLDFTADSTAAVDDSTLLFDAVHEKENFETEKTLSTSVKNDSTFIHKMLKGANWGNPEALALLGRYYEKGVFFKKNNLTAASYYCRAVRVESYKAARLLFDLLKSPIFFTQLKREVEKGNAEAQFVWSSLIAQQFDNQIAGSDALKFLQEAVKKNHLPSIIELGNWNIGGILIAKNIKIGIELWQHAMQLGNKEAEIRFGLLQLLNDDYIQNKNELHQTFLTGESEGSILAQTALGICYERGIFVKKDLAKAVTYYRKAAFRGSQNAFSALKRIYDNLRPDDPRFIVTE
ncbi:MAG: hypothetical protein M0Q21_04875 [Ignavibacteriaceae bacterium]|nr:hypothetical protein [Ignavibacteriaceae bacterium]